MHHHLVEKLLQEQVDAVNRGRVRDRIDGDIRRSGTRVLVPVTVAERSFFFEFDGPNYDADPLSLQVCDGETGERLPAPDWPQGFGAGAHPSLDRPFTCLEGLFEYHCHPSHLDNPWDRHRYSYRLEDIVRVVLDKAGL